MAALVETTSKITAKGQTTIPKAVRQALGIDNGGQIAFRIDRHGVTLWRVEADDGDPVIDRFLVFLADDLERRPEAVTAIGRDLAARLAALTAGAGIDPEAPIDGDIDF